MNPKKSLGQHWLHDEASLEAMVEAGDIAREDTVVEVGPGLGTLTKKLVEVAGEVIAIELDDVLAVNLKSRVGANNLSVAHEDVLEFDFSSIEPGYKVVANIPYYLTSNLIRTLLEASNPPSVMALLVQKEVAERIVAKPGQMSILAISVQFYADAKLLDEVPAELFTPPPKVDSQIIQIKRHSEPLFPDVDKDKFFMIVKAGFSEKRKKLRSSLSGALKISKEDVDLWLSKSGIAPDARAQELSLDDWYKLSEASTV
jgi:16S rRNA (adenine1518-N6/adenine1519-N6)-dimethyltransferase